jgi:hypothetical protein
MRNWTLLFIGVGTALAILGACIFLLNRSREADERLRQTGLLFFAAGAVLAALTAFAARMPPHSH